MKTLKIIIPVILTFIITTLIMRVYFVKSYEKEMNAYDVLISECEERRESFRKSCKDIHEKAYELEAVRRKNQAEIDRLNEKLLSCD